MVICLDLSEEPWLPNCTDSCSQLLSSCCSIHTMHFISGISAPPWMPWELIITSQRVRVLNLLLFCNIAAFVNCTISWEMVTDCMQPHPFFPTWAFVHRIQVAEQWATCMTLSMPQTRLLPEVVVVMGARKRNPIVCALRMQPNRNSAGSLALFAQNSFAQKQNAVFFFFFLPHEAVFGQLLSRVGVKSGSWPLLSSFWLQDRVKLQ